MIHDISFQYLVLGGGLINEAGYRQCIFSSEQQQPRLLTEYIQIYPLIYPLIYPHTSRYIHSQHLHNINRRENTIYLQVKYKLHQPRILTEYIHHSQPLHNISTEENTKYLWNEFCVSSNIVWAQAWSCICLEGVICEIEQTYWAIVPKAQNQNQSLEGGFILSNWDRSVEGAIIWPI